MLFAPSLRNLSLWSCSTLCSPIHLESKRKLWSSNSPTQTAAEISLSAIKGLRLFTLLMAAQGPWLSLTSEWTAMWSTKFSYPSLMRLQLLVWTWLRTLWWPATKTEICRSIAWPPPWPSVIKSKRSHSTSDQKKVPSRRWKWIQRQEACSLALKQVSWNWWGPVSEIIIEIIIL